MVVATPGLAARCRRWPQLWRIRRADGGWRDRSQDLPEPVRDSRPRHGAGLRRWHRRWHGRGAGRSRHGRGAHRRLRRCACRQSQLAAAERDFRPGRADRRGSDRADGGRRSRNAPAGVRRLPYRTGRLRPGAIVGRDRRGPLRGARIPGLFEHARCALSGRCEQSAWTAGSSPAQFGGIRRRDRGDVRGWCAPVRRTRAQEHLQQHGHGDAGRQGCARRVAGRSGRWSARPAQRNRRIDRGRRRTRRVRALRTTRPAHACDGKTRAGDDGANTEQDHLDAVRRLCPCVQRSRNPYRQAPGADIGIT